MTTRRQFMVMALSALGAALLEAGCGDAEGEVEPGPASNDVMDPDFEPAEPINDFTCCHGVVTDENHGS